MTGRELFEGLQVVDRIGHVSHESMETMVEIFRKLTIWGMADGRDPWYRRCWRDVRGILIWTAVVGLYRSLL